MSASQSTKAEEQIRNAALRAANSEWFRHRYSTPTRALVGITGRRVWVCACGATWKGDAAGSPTREEATQWREEHRAEQVESAVARAIRDITTPRRIADRAVTAALSSEPGGGGDDQ